MKNPCVYIKNSIKICFMKIRYKKDFSIGIIQSFEKVRFELKGKYNVKIGNLNQNRGDLYIGVNGGMLSIGCHCFFNINTSITSMKSIKIGNNCKFGNNVVIVDHDHNFKSGIEEFVSSPIVIGNNVWVGANVTILRGSNIGDNCVIGAGSVVRGYIESNSLYVSNKSVDIKPIDRN